MKKGFLKQSEWVEKVRMEHIRKAPKYENELYAELCRRYGKVERYKFFGDVKKYCCFIQLYIPDVRCAIEFDRYNYRDLDEKEAQRKKGERSRFLHSKHVKRFQASFRIFTDENIKNQFFDEVDKFVRERRAGVSVVSDRIMDMMEARSGNTPERREYGKLMGFVHRRLLDELKRCGNCSFCREREGVKYCLRFARALDEDMGHVCPHHSYETPQKQKKPEKVIHKKDIGIEERRRKFAGVTGKPDMKPIREARYSGKRNPE